MAMAFPLLVLVGALFAQAALCGDLSPYIPLLLASASSLCIGLLRGKSWNFMTEHAFKTVGGVSSAMALYLLIGPTISSWIASGTIPALIVQGSNLVSPLTYLPAGFALMGLCGALMGSGISALGTMGIALVAVGRGMGFPLWLIAGALGSGAFWGNAISPLAAANYLSVVLTHSDEDTFLKLLIRQLFIPFALTALGYAVFGFYYAPHLSRTAFSFDILATLTAPAFMSFLPPLVMITLIILRVPTLIVFFTSIVVALIVAVNCGNISIAQIPSLIADGYVYSGNDEMLRGMLTRGGMLSTASILITVMLSMFFGGVYQATGALEELLALFTRGVTSPADLRSRAILGCILTTAATGSSTTASALTGTLFTPKLKDIPLEKTDLALVMGPLSSQIAPIFPWGVNGLTLAGVVGLSLGGADFTDLLYIPFCCASFITPLWFNFAPLSKAAR